MIHNDDLDVYGRAVQASSPFAHVILRLQQEIEELQALVSRLLHQLHAGDPSGDDSAV